MLVGTSPADVPANDADWSILDSLPIAVYACARDGTILRYNRLAVALWGREPGSPDERFCGSYKIYLPDGTHVPHDQCPMAEVLRTGVPARGVEAIFERPDGSRVTCLVNIAPLRDAKGEITGAINCFQDITEAKLREQREQLRAIFETTPECIKIVARDGTLIHMNPAGLRMIEAQGAGDVEGMSTFALIAPEFRDAWRRHHERVCAGEKLSWKFDIIGLAGARRHMESHAAPLRLSDGTLGQLAITRDVTERQQYEAALRESERRMRELLEALPVAIYTTDAAGRVTFYNAAAATLAGREPQIGKDEWCVTWRLREPDGTPLPHEKCPMAIALKENRPVRGVEAVAERPDGTRIPFVPYPTPLRDQSGALIGAVNMLVDVSAQKRHEAELRRLNEGLEERVRERTQELLAEIEERRRIEAQLQQAQKMEAIGQLTGGIAHDFNNLLTAIVNNLELIQLKGGDERVRHHAAAAARAADRGAKLTHQLLAFSRKQYLKAEPTSINELVTGMGEMLLRTLGGKVRVELALSPGLWPALIDASQIESAVLNLAINARDAMPDGGTLTIETANVHVGQLNRVGELSPGDYVMIAVSDTGCGMTEETKAKAFEPFFTTKGVGKGSGLGLSQVYGTAVQSGGYAEIDTAPQRGTTVRLYLPRSRATRTAPRRDLGSRRRELARRAERVLVIDDDEDVREVIASYLGDLGYRVSAAGSGKAAMKLLASQSFDAVVLDFAMPEMDGSRTGRLIRARHPEVPILIITGHAQTPALGDDATFSAILRKPFSPTELDAKLRALIDRPAAASSVNVVPLRPMGAGD